MKIQIAIDKIESIKFRWKKYIKIAQINTAAHQNTSSNKCNVIALSFNQSHLAVFHAANQLAISQITARINIQIEFTSFGSLNLSIACFMINMLHITNINTVIKAHSIEYLAYP